MPNPSANFVQVSSSQLQAVAYDPATKLLEIKFARGGHYEYPNVEPETHANLMKADSIGGFFTKHIRNLPFKKIA